MGGQRLFLAPVQGLKIDTGPSATNNLGKSRGSTLFDHFTTFTTYSNNTYYDMDKYAQADLLCDAGSIFTRFRNSEHMAGPITGHEKRYLLADLSGRLDHLRASTDLPQKVEATVDRMAYWYAMYPVLKSSDRVEDQEAADLIVEWMNSTVENVWGADYVETYDFICRCAVHPDGYTYCLKPECQETKMEVELMLEEHKNLEAQEAQEAQYINSPVYEVTTPSYGVDDD